MKHSKPLPPASRLRALLNYDPVTGALSWAVGRQRVQAGAPIVGKNSRGYICVKIDDKSYKAHRVIWKIMTGLDPVDDIDHKNGDFADNSFANLREATHFQNMANRKIPSDNITGIKGVCFHKKTRKWYAQLQAKNKKQYLGIFDKIEDAEKAVIAARAILHGEFARAA